MIKTPETCADLRKLLESTVYAATLEGSMTTPSAATVSAAADRLHDLLTMLGVDPDECPEHGGPTTAEVLARAALSVVSVPALPSDDAAEKLTHALFRMAPGPFRNAPAAPVHALMAPLWKYVWRDLSDEERAEWLEYGRGVLHQLAGFPSTREMEAGPGPMTEQLVELIEEARKNRRTGWDEGASDAYTRHWGGVVGWLRHKLPAGHPLAFRPPRQDEDDVPPSVPQDTEEDGEVHD